MNKPFVVLVGLLMLTLFSSQALASDVTVTGTFTATGTLDVDVNNSAATFGSIAVSEFGTVYLQVENNGDVVADVTQTQASKDSGAMTIGTNGSLAQDEYAVLIRNDTSGALVDIGGGGGQSIENGLTPTSTKDYEMYVYIASSLSAESHADEQFSADTSVAVDS